MWKRFNNTDASLVTKTQLFHEWVHQLEAEGRKILDLGRGKPSTPAEARAVEAMRQNMDGLHDSAEAALYGTNASGEMLYRTTVAQAFTRLYGTAFEPENIVFTPGGQFGLLAAFMAIAETHPNGYVVCLSPYYLNHVELAQFFPSHRLQILSVPVTPEDDGTMIAAKIEAAVAEKEGDVACFLFCNPANPTGKVLRPHDWRALMPLLTRMDHAAIMLDEAFSELVFDWEGNFEDPSHFNISLLHSAPELKERCFLFRSGTKAMGLSGERLAVMAVPDAYKPYVTRLQSFAIGNPPLAAQAGMAACLEQLDHDRMRVLSEHYQANCYALMHHFKHENRRIWTGSLPDAGFYLLVDYSDYIGTPMPKEAARAYWQPKEVIETDMDIAFALLFGEASLCTIPGSCFGLPESEGWQRLSFSAGEW